MADSSSKLSPVSGSKLSLLAKEFFIEELAEGQPGGPRSIYNWELRVSETELAIKLDHKPARTRIIVNDQIVKQFARH